MKRGACVEKRKKTSQPVSVLVCMLSAGATRVRTCCVPWGRRVGGRARFFFLEIWILNGDHFTHDC